MAKRSREDSPPAGAADSPSLSVSPSQSPSTLLVDTSDSPTSAAPDASHSTKYLQISEQPESRHVAMKCSLAPHREVITFDSFEDFEVHYAQVHTNRCSECHKNFPTDHFLGLHISENHDPLIEARKAREEKTYRCFVEGCDKVCSTPQKRRMHLQAKHYFPKDYDYFIVNDGIDKRSSMLRTRHRRAGSAASRALQRNHRPGGNVPKPEKHSQLDQDQEIRSNNIAIKSSHPKISPIESPSSASTDMDDLTSTMSALKFVPPSAVLMPPSAPRVTFLELPREIRDNTYSFVDDHTAIGRSLWVCRQLYDETHQLFYDRFALILDVFDTNIPKSCALDRTDSKLSEDPGDSLYTRKTFSSPAWNWPWSQKQ
ncbi:MAG: hypothetical protein Q9218_001968 [Villophora microphyllina]